MKKSLVALAVLAFAGAASAQSSVTLYGKFNAGFGKTTGGKLEMRNGADGSDSRFGFRGSEDLGGGLRANFLFEAGVDVESGAFTSANAFQRQIWGGLSGSAGEVRLGRQYTVGFATSIWAMPSTAVNSQLIAGLGFNGAGSRENSVIRYISPNMGGVQGHFSTQLSGDDATRLTEAALTYGNGPVRLNGYVANQKGAPGKAGGYAFNGSYNFGPATVAAGYVDRPGVNTGKGAWVHVGGTVGAFSPWFQIARNTGLKRTAFDFGGYYALSKRTSLYGVFGRNTTAKVSNFAVGVDHAF
jgi:predicted porin